MTNPITADMTIIPSSLEQFFMETILFSDLKVRHGRAVPLEGYRRRSSCIKTGAYLDFYRNGEKK
jgi:hypothetical protein